MLEPFCLSFMALMGAKEQFMKLNMMMMMMYMSCPTSQKI